jgi:hypothetical protein
LTRSIVVGPMAQTRAMAAVAVAVGHLEVSLSVLRWAGVRQSTLEGETPVHQHDVC